MQRTFVIPVSPDSDLEELRLIIEQREHRIGRLVAISPYRGQATWMTFAFDVPPARTIRISAIDASEQPPDVDGFVAICIGDCYIDDVIATVAVYRAKN
jgi:hypothetical protein